MWAAGHPPMLNRLPSLAPYTTSSERATTVPAATKSTVHPPTCAVAPCSSLQTPPPLTPSQTHDPTGRDYHPPTPSPLCPAGRRLCSWENAAGPNGNGMLWRTGPC